MLMPTRLLAINLLITAAIAGPLQGADKGDNSAGNVSYYHQIPPEDESRLLEAAQFMDRNECETVIPAARNTTGLTSAELLDQLDAAAQQFGDNTRRQFQRDGEW